MAWWDELFQPMPTGNLVGDTLSAINGSPVAEARSPETGSFDPNKVRQFIPQGAESDLGPIFDMQTALANQKQQALMEAYKKPESNWVQGIGRAMHALSAAVPGNNPAYTNMIAGNNLQLDWNKRQDQYADKLNELRAGGVSDLYNGLGETGLSYMQDQYKRKQEARSKIAGYLSAGARPDGTIDPEMAAMAEQYAKANGFGRIWDDIKASIKVGTPAEIIAQNQDKRAEGQMRPEDIPAGQGVLPPMLGGFSQMAGNLPGAQKPEDDPANISAATYQRPPEVQAMYDKAMKYSRTGVPELVKQGEIMMAQAKIADKTAADVFAAQQKAKVASRQATSTQLTPIRDPKTGKWSYGQGSTTGKIVVTDMQGYEAPDPVQLAGQKASAREQGGAQGKAAAALPSMENAAHRMITTIDKLINHPGLASITGTIQGHFPSIRSAPREAQSLLNQINSKTFLQAYNDLRGAGAITEREGEAAAKAYSLLSEQGIDDATFKERLQDYRKEVMALQEVARNKAVAGLIPPNAKVLDLGDKKLYRGDDGHWYESQEEATKSAGNAQRLSIKPGSIRRID